MMQPGAFNPDGSISWYFKDVSTGFKLDTLYQACGGRVAPHTLKSCHAHRTFCGDTVMVFTCSCGLVFSYVVTQDGGCGADHHPPDVARADEWHRALVLFDGSRSVEVDVEKVQRDTSILS